MQYVQSVWESLAVGQQALEGEGFYLGCILLLPWSGVEQSHLGIQVQWFFPWNMTVY